MLLCFIRCVQVPDAVPGGCAGVSIVPVLREDQEAVDSLSAAGGGQKLE